MWFGKGSDIVPERVVDSNPRVNNMQWKDVDAEG